ncbi:MAG: VanZ family protein [Flavobacterium sp.]
MKPTKTFWEYNNFFKIFVTLWTLIVLFLSLSSFENLQVPIKVSGFDKMAHFVMYSLYAFLLIFSFKDIKAKKINFYLYIFLYLFLFGLFIEFLQGITTEKRKTDMEDALANGIGALIGIVVAYAIIKRVKKNSLIII